MSEVQPDVYRYPFDASMNPKAARDAGRSALAKILKVADKHTTRTSFNEVDGDVRDYAGGSKPYKRWIERQSTHAFPKQRGLRMKTTEKTNPTDNTLPGGHIQAEHLRWGHSPTLNEEAVAGKVEVLYSEYQHPPRLQVIVFKAEALPGALVQGLQAIGLRTGE